MSLFRIERLDAVSSTNDVVKRALDKGEPEGFACRARMQTGGYGRQGRTWSSPVGGMYQSLLLRPKVKREVLPTVGIVIALSIRAALLEFGTLHPNSIRVKWPNDVVCARGKLAGLSLETHAEGVCAGLGVNVFRPEREASVRGKYVPAYLEDLASSPLDRRTGVDDVGDAILAVFESRYALWQERGLSPFIGDFESCDALFGKRVQMVLPDGSSFLEGEAAGIDAQGRLLVRTLQGVRAVTSGEAHIL